MSNKELLVGNEHGISTYVAQLWKVLGNSPKNHCEECHRNPKVAGQREELLCETGNNPF